MLCYSPRLAFMLLMGVAACGPVDRSSADGLARTGRLVALSGGDAGAAGACFTCHGLDGRGDGAGAPRLAGLDRGYLHRQMEAYASGLRIHEQMGHVAKQMSADQRAAVAAFYAGMAWQRPATPPGPAPALYLAGDPARGIPACAACHGAEGQGNAGNPPLAGQPAAYQQEQIAAWVRSDRRGDPGNVMQAISRKLDSRESAALAAYASRLAGAPPRPVSPEAYRAAHRADPRNDASALRPHEAEP